MLNALKEILLSVQQNKNNFLYDDDDCTSEFNVPPSNMSKSSSNACNNIHNNNNNNQLNNNNNSAKINNLNSATTMATTTTTDQAMYVGCYKLEKTLGKGQTGLVKLGIHYLTGRKMAIKIVNKEKLSDSVLQKVEREIAIMKLIEHPHILHLYDVYENKKYLYLVLEHVGNGELFDYLVRKGRLSSKEAKKFFRQILSALDFCHAHNVCHRDLKPENLLLDDKNNIKVADFGMASLQVEGSMLETSCGSPHYACPEVIRGEKYDGKKADVWSCGVILYALLVGALPFDDDNLRNLLEKVKKGVFHIPHFVPPDCQSLLRAMIEVDPNKRISLADIFRHPWVNGTTKSDSFDLELPMAMVVQTHVIPSEENIDPDVFRHMTSLGCFKDREKLMRELLNPRHNTEKIVYFLLLDRKRRKPACDDDAECSTAVRQSSAKLFDPPKKRVDTAKYANFHLGSISDGSPINPRKTYGRLRYNSAGGSPNESPVPTPRNYNMNIRNTSRSNLNNYYISGTNSVSPTIGHTITSPVNDINNAASAYTVRPTPPPSPLSSQPGQWRSKLTNIKNTLMGTPRFHRRKMSGDSDSEDLDTTNLVKKSWFDSFTSNSSVDKEKDEVFCIAVQSKSLNWIKAELIRAFLTIHELSHSIVGQSSFRIEYKRGSSSGSSMFSRGLRLSVDILPSTQVQAENDEKATYVIQFTLITGPVRRFRRLVEHLSAIIQSSCQRGSSEMRDQQQQMVRPRRLSDASVSSNSSDPENKDQWSKKQIRINKDSEKAQNVVATSLAPPAATGTRSVDRRGILKSPIPSRRNTNPTCLLASSTLPENKNNKKTFQATNSNPASFVLMSQRSPILSPQQTNTVSVFAQEINQKSNDSSAKLRVVRRKSEDQTNRDSQIVL